LEVKQIKKLKNLGYYDTIILPYVKKEKVSIDNLEIKNDITKIMNSSDFEKNSDSVFNSSILLNDKILKVIFLEIKKDRIDIEDIFLNFAKGYKKCRNVNGKNILVLLDNIKNLINDYSLYKKIIESAYLTNYSFDKYKNKKDKNKFEKIDFKIDIENFYDACIEAKYTSEGTILTRNLVNEPPMRMTPEILAKEAEKAGQESGFKVIVYGKSEIEELKMNAFLSVGKGSVNEPKLIVMEYSGSDSSEKIGLIGKGLTYDSGGYSIKPSKSMSTMHSDMAGSAAVIGAMKVVSNMKLKVNVVAVVAACENRISQEAYLPGDILESMSGKFIEVNNTDAEGRLTLADAATYIKEKHNVKSIVDIATLTGAIITALGKRRAGSFSNNDELHSIIEKASKISGEKIWRLPCDEELKESIKSNVADIRNSTQGSTIGGGSITAALFIKEFVEETPWVHIDIAGTSWTDVELPYAPKGGVGYGAMLLYQYVKMMEV